MSTDQASSPPAAEQRPTDRQDERLRQAEGLSGAVRAFVDRLRAGDLGVVPVIGGLVVIALVLQLFNPVFLSSTNLVNLLLESVPVGMIALGIVVVLLVGQIDLSVGSVSGLSSATLAVLYVSQGQPALVALVLAILTGTAIGLFYGFIFTRFSIPSFVISLAGLLGFLGLQLYVLRGVGSINLPFDSPLVYFAQLAFLPAWLSYVFVVVLAVGLLATGLGRSRERRGAGLSGASTTFVVVRSVLVVVVLGAGVAYLNTARGVGWMFVLFLGLVMAMNYVLTRTKYGTYLFAVGGNAEAARRAGINVRRVYIGAFVTCSTLAALGGVLAASRLAAANQSTGTGDVNLNAIAAAVIGGTSLFGGRGTAFAALLGILVIQSISSGLTLLNLDSSFRFMVTGAVLLLAVGVDSVARSSRASHGRG